MQKDRQDLTTATPALLHGINNNVYNLAQQQHIQPGTATTTYTTWHSNNKNAAMFQKLLPVPMMVVRLHKTGQQASQTLVVARQTRQRLGT